MVKKASFQVQVRKVGIWPTQVNTKDAQQETWIPPKVMPVEGRRARPAPWPQVTAFQENASRDRGDRFTWVIRPQTAPTVRAAKAEGTERAPAAPPTNRRVRGGVCAQRWVKAVSTLLLSQIVCPGVALSAFVCPLHTQEIRNRYVNTYEL